jgi:hypothetical protein
LQREREREIWSEEEGGRVKFEVTMFMFFGLVVGCLRWEDTWQKIRWVIFGAVLIQILIDCVMFGSYLWNLEILKS